MLCMGTGLECFRADNSFARTYRDRDNNNETCANSFMSIAFVKNDLAQNKCLLASHLGDRFAEADKRIRIFSNGRNMVKQCSICEKNETSVEPRPCVLSVGAGRFRRAQPWSAGGKRTVRALRRYS